MSRRLGLPVGLGVLALALWAFDTRSPGRPGAGPALAAAPAKTGDPDPLGYTAAFDRELGTLGQITPAQFAARYRPPVYLPGPTWDPTTAKFFDKLHADVVVKEHPDLARTLAQRAFSPEEVANIKRNMNTALPGYRLNPDELAAYKRNGFVASERLGGQSFGQVYYDVYTRDLPVFVSTDSVLHAWHRSYDGMLAELESTYLTHALDAILAGMHDAVPAAHAGYGRGVLKDSVRDADYFLAVARSLLQDAPVPTKLNQDDRVKDTLAAVAALRTQKFVLFGRERSVDFSQFKPRGHYEADPQLRKYFRAMMWCGRTDLRVAGGYDATGPLSSDRELGSAIVLLDLLRKAGGEDSWRQFDRAIQTFVGRTDSATFEDLARVAAAAKIASPADLKTDDDLKKLTAAVQESDAGKQDVRGDVYVSPHRDIKVSLPRSFTVLGQKFAVDSWVTAKVVYDDIIWNEQKVARRVPSGLDVAFAALGNNHVVPDLLARLEAGTHPQRDKKPYQHNLAAAREVVDHTDPRAWDDTIYTSWLKSLRTLSAPVDANMPEAMRTRAWAMKQLNTQLASWTQLRHDTILYVKQSYTAEPSCYYPAGFVEPVVPFWAQMEATAARSADLLGRTPFPPAVAATQTKQVKFLRAFSAQMGRLKAVAVKQLAQGELTPDEKKVLEDVMQIGHQRVGSGSRPKYTGWYPALFYNGPEDCVKWDALVADVHTDTPSVPDKDPGSVLHQGVGNVDLLVVAVDNGKDRVVYAGPSLSHYEFETPFDARKTDKEWKADLLDAKPPRRPDWTRGHVVPHPDRKPVDKWVREAMLSAP